MSISKTIPIFKILAIACLAVVSIVQITVMADNTSEYNQVAEKLNSEYMSIAYYVVGFSFLISTFFTLFSLGKRNSSVIMTSVEFLFIIIVGYYIKENEKIIFEAEEELVFLLLLLLAIYSFEFELVIGFSIAALVLGILDLTVGSSFAISPNLNECIYCGRRLRPGEKCNCDLNDTYVINDFDTDPENYADDVEKRKCVFCGRLLYGTEKCNCPGAARTEEWMRGGHDAYVPTYNPPPPNGVYPTPYGGYENPAKHAEPEKSRTFINKPFDSRPPISTEPPRYTPPSKPADMPKREKPGDERFFSKPSDL